MVAASPVLTPSMTPADPFERAPLMISTYMDAQLTHLVSYHIV